MGTKNQDNTIITEEEKIVGQDQGGSIVPEKDISSPSTVKNPSPKQGEGGADLQDAIKRHSDPTYKVDKIIDKPSISSPPKQGEVKPAFDMQTMINDLNDREETARKQNEEERKKESRYHRARSIISAIGDGLSGLANIYFTTKGAPDMLKGTTSMSAKQQERWDKIRKEREARRANYLKVVQEGADQKVENMYTRYKDELEAKRKEREIKVKEADQKRKELQEKRLQAESEARILLLNAKADEAEQKAIIAELYAAKTPEEVDLKLQEIRSRIAKNNRGGSGGGSGGSGRSSGGGSGGGSGRGAGNYSAYGADGKLYFFKSKSDAQQFAMNEGTWRNSQTSGDKENRTTTPGYSKNPKKGPVRTGKKGKKWNSE